jgi:nitrite reductase/ring-hydroxylating ferredoxin subunit
VAEVAVFNVGGEFYAIDNSCPHRGGPLGEGELEDCIVTCPWHEFRFDVRTGKCIDTGYELPDPRFSLRSHRVEKGDDGWLYLTVSTEPAAGEESSAPRP